MVLDKPSKKASILAMKDNEKKFQRTIKKNYLALVHNHKRIGVQRA